MKINDISTPVVVLKSVGHGGLNIMRSLGRLGIPLYDVDADRFAPTFFSRYCRGKTLWDIDEQPADRSLEFLLDLGRKIGQPSILIPTTDDATVFVADHADALRERFIFPDQRPELVRSLCSKKEAYCVAKKFGVPTAETVFPDSREDVLRFLENAVFPIMLKGIDGRRLWIRAGKKMFIIHNHQELLEKYDAFEETKNSNLMLQEYIPGGDDTVWMFNGYFDERSECLVGFTGKKIRQCPVHRGVTSLGICLRNDTVERTTKEFMKVLGYRGILDIGYRYDARDGLYKVLDINPRIGASFRLFVAENGMDVARALYLDLTGQPVVSVAAREGRKWLVEDLDLVSSFRYRAEGNLRFKQWLGSFRGVEEAAFFAPDDLLPFVVMGMGRTGELGRRVYNKLHQLVGVRLSRSPSGWPNLAKP